MDEYGSNSHKSREASQRPNTEKKVEKVVSGKTNIKKKGEIRKFADAFIKDDVSNIGSFIFGEVLIPAIKNVILDSVKTLLGDTRSTSSTASKVSYRKYYEDDNRRDYSGRSSTVRSGFDYDDILFTTRSDAVRVLDAMDDIISTYRIVSVGDLYDLANAYTDNYTINNYGWTDIRGAKVVSVREGYIIKLPRALPLK